MQVVRLKTLKKCYLLLFVFVIAGIILFITRNNNTPRKPPPEKSRNNKEVHLVLPKKSNLKNIPHSKLAAIYHTYINTLQVGCDNIIRLGEEADGGWEVCDDVIYRPKAPCLVYSFGIDNDFSFDDSVSEKYGCEVHSFDPSMNMKEMQRKPKAWFHPYAIGPETKVHQGNKWHMFTIPDIKSKLGHKDRSLTILKVDVEEWEMLVLPNLVKDRTLESVDQLLIEFHITTRPEPNRDRYILGLEILADLYNMGFRIFWTSRNLFCRFTSLEDDIERTGCNEVSFVNIRKWKNSS